MLARRPSRACAPTRGTGQKLVQETERFERKARRLLRKRVGQSPPRHFLMRPPRHHNTRPAAAHAALQPRRPAQSATEHREARLSPSLHACVRWCTHVSPHRAPLSAPPRPAFSWSSRPPHERPPRGARGRATSEPSHPACKVTRGVRTCSSIQMALYTMRCRSTALLPSNAAETTSILRAHGKTREAGVSAAFASQKGKPQRRFLQPAARGTRPPARERPATTTSAARTLSS